MKTCCTKSATDWSHWRRSEILALSKAVLHALGCVATKIGLVDMVSNLLKGSLDDGLRAIYISSRARVAQGIDRISGQLIKSAGFIQLTIEKGEDGNCASPK